MKSIQISQRNAGFFTFFLSGICAISSGIIVSILQETYRFDYGITGTLLSLMNIGNLLAGFAAGILPSKIGMKKTVVLLTFGYGIGYFLIGISGWVWILMIAFFLVGIGKGSTINTCTILVGNHSKDRTKGMNLMHSCYAFGALLCPFFIAAAANINRLFPMFLLGTLGAILWIAFVKTPMEIGNIPIKQKTDWGFLKNKKFWLITGLLFSQNAAEISVNGWLVTYFKDSGIISGELSPYTVTVMWTATLIARMLIAFVVPIKDAASSMIKMGIGCIIFYICTIMAHTQLSAIVFLFAFAFFMAGMNPTAVASAGRMTSVTSMGVMLPVASSGAIIMPWIIGIIAEHGGIELGMASNIIPCTAMLLFAIAVKRLQQKEQSLQSKESFTQGKERLDIVDQKGIPTGKTIDRIEAHKKGVLHRTSHVWLLRKKEGKVQILLQKRSDNKDSYPGCYDISSAGHIPAGTDFIPSALRELKEELGVTAKESDLHYCGQRQYQYEEIFYGKVFKDNQISNIYAMWMDREENWFQLQKEEVAEVKWFDLEECIILVEEKKIPNCIFLDELELVKRYILQMEKGIHC